MGAMTFVLDSLYQAWLLALQSAPYLLIGFLIAGLIHAFLPAERVVRWLGKPGWRSVINAALIGTPLPLCSCSVVPVAAALRKAGASRGATASFLISTPESGVDSMLATWALLDPLMTVARPVAAFVTAMIAGLAENLLGDTEPSAAKPMTDLSRGLPLAAPRAGGLSLAVLGPIPMPIATNRDAAPPGGDCCSHEAAATSGNSVTAAPDCCSRAEPPKRNSLLTKIVVGLRFGYVRMFEDMGTYLLAGFLVAGLVSVLLARFDVLSAALATPWAPLLMLIAGIPVYVCASSATPLIAVLISQGLSPGAGLVFLLSGPATNAATIVLVRQMIGGRGLVIYLTAIAVSALAAGYAVNGLYALLELTPRALVQAGECHTHPGVIAVASAVVLAALTVNGIVRQIVRR